MNRRRQALLAAGLFAGVWAVAVAVRWTRLPEASALGDSLGPWLVAARGPWQTRPHAPPYGWLLAVPHALILSMARDLWSAFAAIRVVDAMVAPVVALAVLRRGRSPWRALAAGLLLAFDPGLIDTATSGAEAYQAPVAISMVVLATTAGRARWGPWLAGGAFAWALMCHPLSLVAVPLLARVRWRRSPAAVWATGLLVLPHAWSLARAAGGAASESPSLPSLAFQAWVDQAGPVVGVFALAALGVLRMPRMRLPVGLGAVLLVLAGTRLGYLRDHHVRLLSPPLTMGLAAVPGPLSLGAVALTARWPTNPATRRGGDRRPGSLGLLHKVGSTLLSARTPGRPMLVDGATDHGVLAVEPGGLLLDLSLRGVPPDQLTTTDDGDVVIILSGQRHHIWLDSPASHDLERIGGRDTWTLYMGRPDQLRAWSVADCERRREAGQPAPRVGGAWDGLALFHPELGAEAVDWWACARDSPAAAQQPTAELQ